MKNLLLILFILLQHLNVFSQKYSLDSIVFFTPIAGTEDFENNLLVAFQYNADSLLSSKTFIGRDDMTGDTLYQNLDVFKYNPDGMISRHVEYDWYAATGVWDLYLVETYTYGINPKQDTIIEFHYVAGEITSGKRTIFKYNTINQVTTECQDEWDTGTQQWIGYLKWENTYNPHKELSSQTLYTYSTATLQYIPEIKSEYAYAPGHLLLRTTNSTWLNDHWQLDSRRTNKYKDTIVIQTIGEVWYQPTGPWIDDFKDTSYYDGKQLTRFVRYSWYMDLQTWYPDDSVSYSYDSFNNIIDQTAYYGSNDPGNPWIPTSRDEWVYNETIDFDSIIWPFEPGELINVPYSKQLTNNLEYNYVGGWVISFKNEYYYGPFVVGVAEAEYLPDAIYPNPASDEVWLKLPNLNDHATLQLYSAKGEKVSEWKIVEQESIPVNQLPSGIYFYFIHSGEKNYVGKLIISR
ncbi:MAG TPA: T9SS type A sorting domain-containing protein [Saprospiraceae bacterium]|nr:T9SS type A sorting domain-containing protein [Saprospiraceae bacterium]